MTVCFHLGCRNAVEWSARGAGRQSIRLCGRHAREMEWTDPDGSIVWFVCGPRTHPSWTSPWRKQWWVEAEAERRTPTSNRPDGDRTYNDDAGRRRTPGTRKH